jgi:hypothetical protein
MNTTKNRALTQVLRKGRQIGNDIFLNTPPTEQFHITTINLKNYMWRIIWWH